MINSNKNTDINLIISNNKGNVILYEFYKDFYNKYKQIIPFTKNSIPIDNIIVSKDTYLDPAAAIIIKDINNTNGFWFLHPEPLASNPSHLYYTLNPFYLNNFRLCKTYIDLNANGGKGEITDTFRHDFLFSKKYSSIDASNNIPLPSLYDAVKTSFGYWIIGRYGDTLLAWPFSKNGFGKPVKSIFAETSHPMGNDIFGPKYLECRYNPIRFSNDGTFAVSLNCNIDPKYNYSASYIYTYNFDKSTGHFFNQKCIYQSKPINNFHLKDAYDTTLYSPVNKLDDVAFSSNDSLFYVSSEGMYNPNGPNADSIFCFSRYQNTQSFIKYFAFPKKFYRHDALLGIPLFTGPNGKIYFTKFNFDTLAGLFYYGEIWNADSLTSSKLVEHKNLHFAQMNIRTPYYHHPGFVRAHFKKTCHGYEFKNVSDSIFKHFTWYFGDGDSLNNDSKAHFTHIYKTSGPVLFRLKGTDANGYTAWYSDSLIIDGSVSASIDLIGLKTACQWSKINLQDSICFQVNLKNDSVFKWDFGDSTFAELHNPVHIYTKPGKYVPSLILNNGVDSFRLYLQDTLLILPAPKPVVTVDVSSGCAPLTVHVSDQSKAGFNRVIKSGNGQQDTAANATFVYKDTGKFFIHLYEKNAQCETEDSVLITVKEGVSETPEILYVSVLSDKSIGIYWQPVKGLKYSLRRISPSAAVIADELAGGFYLDSNVNTSDYSYSYVLTAKDECLQQSKESLPVLSILLRGTAVPSPGTSARLNWNAYNGRFDHYTLYTSKDSIDNGLVSEFEDRNYLLDTSAGNCYMVAAQDNKNHFRSFSNLLCIPYAARVYVPDIFTPNNDSVNATFRIASLGVQEYHLKIYNRWGEMIFESNDPQKSWDGRIKGSPCPEGIYFYVLSVKGYDGVPKWLKGNVTLMR